MARGFTLIELVLVIAILGILAIAALPALYNVSLTTAKNNSMKAVVAAVQTGISLYAANGVATAGQPTYPATLDSASPGAASGSTPLFTNVLNAPVTTQWIKKSDTCYIYDFNGTGVYAAGDTYYQYTVATGTFAAISSC